MWISSRYIIREIVIGKDTKVVRPQMLQPPAKQTMWIDRPPIAFSHTHSNQKGFFCAVFFPFCLWLLQFVERQLRRPTGKKNQIWKDLITIPMEIGGMHRSVISAHRRRWLFTKCCDAGHRMPSSCRRCCCWYWRGGVCCLPQHTRRVFHIFCACRFGFYTANVCVCVCVFAPFTAARTWRAFLFGNGVSRTAVKRREAVRRNPSPLPSWILCLHPPLRWMKIFG